MASFSLTLDNLKAWCQRQSLDFRPLPDLGQIAVAYRVLDRDCPLLLIPREDVHMLTLAMVLPLPVPEERAAAVREALGLLNHATYMGAWVLSPETSEIYFRLTLPAQDVEFTDPGLFLCARTVVSTVEMLAPKLQRVADRRAAAPPDSVLPAPQ